MTVLVLLYLVVGLFSTAMRYLINPEQFNEDFLKKCFPSESSQEVRTILSVFTNTMIWPSMVFLKIREKNNE